MKKVINFIELTTSVDSRETNLHDALHWAISDDLGSRTNFLIDTFSSRGKLKIKNVNELDQGVFRCRVDFDNSPTTNSRVNLTLIGKFRLLIVTIPIFQVQKKNLKIAQNFLIFSRMFRDDTRKCFFMCFLRFCYCNGKRILKKKLQIDKELVVGQSTRKSVLNEQMTFL